MVSRVDGSSVSTYYLLVLDPFRDRTDRHIFLDVHI